MGHAPRRKIMYTSCTPFTIGHSYQLWLLISQGDFLRIGMQGCLSGGHHFRKIATDWIRDHSATYVGKACFLFPTNILTVWCASFLVCMTHYCVPYPICMYAWVELSFSIVCYHLNQEFIICDRILENHPYRGRVPLHI